MASQSFTNDTGTPTFILVRQYQTFARAIIPPVTVEKWLNPFAIPVRVKAGLPTHEQQFLAFVKAAPFPETVTESRWHQPWSEPSVKTKAGLHPARQQFLALVKAAPFPETVTESRWHQPWSEPVRYRTLATALRPTPVFDPFPRPSVTTTEDQWHQAWSEPVRERGFDVVAGDAGFPTPTTTAETVTLDKWYREFSIPVRLKPGLGPQYQQVLAFIKETFTEIQWQQPWSMPVRETGFDVVSDTQIVPFQAESIFEDKWHQAWSEPTRRQGVKTHLQQSTAFSPFPIPNVVVKLEWLVPLSEPVRRVGFQPQHQQVTTWFGIQDFFPFTVDGGGIVFGRTTQYQAEAYPIPIVAAPVTPIDWVQEIYQPQPQGGFDVVGFSGDFVVPITTETVTVDKWFQPLSSPVRQKIGLGVYLQQVLAFVKAAPFGETILEDKWHQQWSSPVRTLAGLKTYLQQFTTLDPFPRPNVTVSEDQWHQPWSEPVRYRGIRPQFQVALIQPLPVTVFVDKYYGWLSEPVRQKRGLQAWHQQFIALVKAAPFPETVTESRWHQPWSEPVRVKPGLRTGVQQFYSGIPAPVVLPTITARLDATETQDVFLGEMMSWMPVASAYVSIHEIVIPRQSYVSIVSS